MEEMYMAKKGNQQIEDTFHVDSSHLISTVCNLFLKNEEKLQPNLEKMVEQGNWKIYMKHIYKKQPLKDFGQLLAKICEKFNDKTYNILKFILDNQQAEDELHYWKYLGMWKEIAIIDDEPARIEDRVNFLT